MNIRVFGCRKFKKLVNDGLDRDLNDRELIFMDRHRNVCTPCRQSERQSHMALNMLRLSAWDVDEAPGYEEKLIRKVRLQNARASFGYWSPALLGAAIAGVVVMAALQMISNSEHMPTLPLDKSGAEARRINTTSPQFPDVDFLRPDHRAR